MADRENVIKGLRDIEMFIAGRLGYEQAKNFMRTIDETIALLKEQEAVQCGIDSDGNPRCGACGSIQTYGCKFCDNCGKPVLWEGR